MKGDTRKVIRIIPSPIEYWISTSDAADSTYLQSFVDKGLSLEDSILAASESAPFGVDALRTGKAA